jgi:predicted Ser/Thr protein kinase
VTPRTPPRAETGRIGRYTLLARIGEGGMGVVHLARGPDGRDVALKVLRPHVVGDDEGRARLAREVSSLRRVRSPRVAEVYDADPWGEQPYLVTRYVSGPSLHDLVRERAPLDGDDLRTIAVGLAEAVSAVHQAGVLHRDVKPSNVLVEGRADPVLIDFGLAKVSDDTRLTATGFLMGTPGYLAPEVLYGADPTPAADVHAWAATVTFAATGESPFGRGPAMAVMDRARRGEFDLSGVPEWLRPLLVRCLAPEPADRPGVPEVLDRLTGPHGPAVPPAPATRPLTVAAPVRRPDRPVPPTPRRPEQPSPSRGAEGPGRSSRVVRVLALLGLLGLFAGAVALAWLVRAASWSADAIADRRALRGQRRSDGVVRLLAAPWHVVASLPGTVVLMLAVSLATALPALTLAALGTEEARALFLGGVAGALTLWWGPGGRRIRRPTRRVLWSAGRSETGGVAAVGLLLGAVVALLVAIGSAGVQWWPDTGPPLDPRDLLPPGFR